MGYRSDVVLTMKREDIIELLHKAAQADNVHHNADEFLCGPSIHVYKDGYVSLYFEDMKWYHDLEEIALVTQFIDEAVSQGKDVAFMRIGDDIDDCEIVQSGNLCASTKTKPVLIRTFEFQRNETVDITEFMQERK